MNLKVVLKTLLVCMVIVANVSFAPAVPTTQAQSVQSSNWQLVSDGETIKGFLDKPSAANGDTVSLYVSTPAPRFDVDVYRLGWYNGGGDAAELVASQRNIAGRIQPAALVDNDTGFISASNWSASTTLRVDNWRTGLYLLKLTGSDGDQNYVQLVVRDDVRHHDFLFVHTAATDQAYNNWGGKSTYDTNSTGQRTVGGTTAAVKVSFDRPYSGNGAGPSIANWELNMVRFLESNSFDVAYTTDVDVSGNPQFDANVNAVIQAGHNEYWSKEIRDNMEAARLRHKGLGFFTGDTSRWAVRFEDSSLGANHVMVSYKNARVDPTTETDPSRATDLWVASLLRRPVQLLIGIGSNGQMDRSADWVAAGADAEPGLFANTGFSNGDVVPNLVGYEYDGLWTDGSGSTLPPGVQVLGRAQVAASNPIASLLNFAAVNQVKNPRPPIGTLSTMVQTTSPGLSWSLYVHFLSASSSRHFLQYQPGDGSPSQYQSSTGDYAVFKLGKDFTKVGWHEIKRDLIADYTAAFGPLDPDPPRVDHMILGGSMSILPLNFVDANGAVSTVPILTEDSTAAGGWHVELGTGDIGVQSVGPSGEQALTMQISVPSGHRADEADSVVLRGTNAGLVVAVGSIQWAWALDGFGKHVDPEGNSTPVDARIQALTRNMLQALLGRS